MTGSAKGHGFVGITFDVGMAVYSGSDEDGYPIVQHDAQGDKAGVGASEQHHTFGFASRPRDPDVDAKGKPIDGKGCNLLIGVRGNEAHYWLGYDPRFIPLVPPLKKGGSVRYCAAGSFQVFDGDDGTDTLYVPVPGGKAHVVTTGIDGNGDPYIGIEHANGMSVTMLHKSLVLKNAAGDAYIELNDDGTVFNGNSKMVGALICGDVAAAQPVAMAPELLSYLSALEQILGTLAGAIDGKTPSTPGATTGVVRSALAASAALKASISATLLKAL